MRCPSFRRHGEALLRNLRPSPFGIGADKPLSGGGRLKRYVIDYRNHTIKELPMTPSIMRMVLYVLPDGSIRPAVIHEVHSDLCVSLSVFCGANDRWVVAGTNSREVASAVERRTSVMLDQDGKQPGTWHWNEHQLASGKPSH